MFTYQYKLKPTKEQRILLAKHCGATRFVWNRYLNQRVEIYRNENRSIGYYDQCKDITLLKKQEEFKWLREINAQSIQQCLDQLDTAFGRFFKKKAKFPNFKNKSNGGSFKIPQRVVVENNKIYFPKFKEGIKLILHREFECEKICYCTIKKRNDDYYAFISVQKDIQPLEKTGTIVGIDLGVKDIVITSDGKKFDNPKALERYEKRLRHYQKKLSRQIKGSKGREKTRKHLSRVHEKISNLRNNTIHNITTQLVKENDVIVMEDLNVEGMMRNHHLAKAIVNVSFSRIKRQLEYKCQWYGKKLIKIDRYFPSSKTCNYCGYINNHLTLNDRVWECPQCASKIDRDINAAKNIRDEGLRQENRVATTQINDDGVESKTTPNNELVEGNAAIMKS